VYLVISLYNLSTVQLQRLGYYDSMDANYRALRGLNSTSSPITSASFNATFTT
jgi:hypothetical protein